MLKEWRSRHAPLWQTVIKGTHSSSLLIEECQRSDFSSYHVMFDDLQHWKQRAPMSEAGGKYVRTILVCRVYWTPACARKPGNSNSFLSETSILFFFGMVSETGKTPQMVTFTCCSCYMLLNNTTNTPKGTEHGFIGLSKTISVKMDCQHNIHMKEA